LINYPNRAHDRKSFARIHTHACARAHTEREREFFLFLVNITLL